MSRELSAGVVLVRRMRGRWWFAAIRPRGKPEGTWALPKGLVEQGEPVAAAALREATEETGLAATLAGSLGSVRYVYTRPGGERVFKVVTFFLARAGRGRLGELAPEQRLEVADARWLPLEEGPELLAYGGERDVVRRARSALDGEPL